MPFRVLASCKASCAVLETPAYTQRLPAKELGAPSARLQGAQVDCPIPRALGNLLGGRGPRGIEFWDVIHIALICILPSAIQAVHPDVHFRQRERQIVHLWIHCRLQATTYNAVGMHFCASSSLVLLLGIPSGHVCYTATHEGGRELASQAQKMTSHLVVKDAGCSYAGIQLTCCVRLRSFRSCSASFAV